MKPDLRLIWRAHDQPELKPVDPPPKRPEFDSLDLWLLVCLGACGFALGGFGGVIWGAVAASFFIMLQRREQR